MAFDRNKYIKIFFAEVDEQLIQLNSLLVELEANRENIEVVQEIFRIVHTMKGNAAAIGFNSISEFAHKIEDVLELIRQNRLEFSQSIADVVFESLDRLQIMLGELRGTGKEPGELPGIINILQKISTGDMSWTVQFERKSSTEQIKLTETARVPMRSLDMMINLIGEMIINLSRLETINQQVKNRELKDTIAYLRRIVSQIQHNIMDVRLVPLSSIFDQFPRMVRDISQEEMKEVSFTVEGTDIQLDSKVIEKIKTPIIQITRNAISHGIEFPEERTKLGKPETGSVKISVNRDKDRVIVSITDDGRGMDTRKIAETAINMKLVTPEHIEQMARNDILELVFEPGFTTASKTSKISGRGVGMDAVRAELASISGNISIDSQLGKGTTITLDVPTSIAIIKALLCEVCGKHYAFPITVIEAVKSVPIRGIHKMNGEKAFVFEDKLLPLLDVETLLFGTEPDFSKKTEIDIVVVNTMPKLIGFSVDKFIREEDIVVKPLNIATDIRSVSGASLLGDGSVVLILDTNEMVKRVSLRKGG